VSAAFLSGSSRSSYPPPPLNSFEVVRKRRQLWRRLCAVGFGRACECGGDLDFDLVEGELHRVDMR
jgi:hypothetical protein